MVYTHIGDNPLLQPFGLHFREVLPRQPQAAQTTSEPEITTADGSDPDKIDADWLPDEDEDKEEEEQEEKE